MSKESTQEVVMSESPQDRPEAVVDPAAPQEPPAPEPGAVDDLQRQLQEARARCDEHAEALLRARAELDNVRKRSERELQNAHKFALERFVQELLPVKDSMEMGLAAASEDGADVQKLREGTELTLRMLSAATEKFGVCEVNPVGEPFDPERHQAISTVDSATSPAGTVVTVIQKGYLLNDRLVRPAMVMVAK